LIISRQGKRRSEKGRKQWVSAKLGLWTVDWNVDWTVDWTVDCPRQLRLKS